MGTYEVDAGAAGGVNNTVVGRTIGRIIYFDINPFANMAGTVIGHAHFQSSVTSLFEFLSQINAYNKESAGGRISRLCGENGINFVTYSFTETALMGSQRIDTLNNLINECVATDMGTYHDSRSYGGYPVTEYRPRAGIYNQLPMVTLDLSLGQVAPPWEPKDDDQQKRNDVTASKRNGGKARAVLSTGAQSTLAPSAGGIGPYVIDYPCNPRLDTQLPDIASWVLALGTVDEYRFPNIRTDLGSSKLTKAIRNQLLDVNVDDLIRITNANSSRIYGNIDQIARGYSETFRQTDYAITFNCSANSPYNTGLLDANNRLDSGTSTVNTAMNTTITSMSVATSNALDLWTTVAGEFPFDISVGGEAMTVTAITGATSPQTFTVTRSVNGVVKTQPVGAEVRALTPLRYAL
jgi:hypothetical protein